MIFFFLFAKVFVCATGLLDKKNTKKNLILVPGHCQNQNDIKQIKNDFTTK